MGDRKLTQAREADAEIEVSFSKHRMTSGSGLGGVPACRSAQQCGHSGKLAALEPFEEGAAGRGYIGEVFGYASGVEGRDGIPPPATETSLPALVASAAARASANVPSPNGAISKAPSGPFQSRVSQRDSTSV